MLPNLFFQDGAFYDRSKVMEVNGLSVVLNMPKAREKRFEGAVEVAQSLPEYGPRACFLVDDFPNAVKRFGTSKPNEVHYFVPIEVGHGLWLDFNGALSATRHHLAVMVNTQGVNAVTGRETELTKPVLEQFKTHCPDHPRNKFGAKLRCSKCGYEWPPQNYLASAGTPRRMFWLDGFRTPKGEVRQWVFTDDPTEGVANAIIGEKKATQDLRIVFFKSKQERPIDRPVRRGGFGYPMGSAIDHPVIGAASLGSRSPRVDIGRGARIHQEVYADPNPVDFYESKPAGTIVIHYVTSADARKLIKSPANRKATEGFLAKVPTKKVARRKKKSAGPHKTY